MGLSCPFHTGFGLFSPERTVRTMQLDLTRYQKELSNHTNRTKQVFHSFKKLLSSIYADNNIPATNFWRKSLLNFNLFLQGVEAVSATCLLLQ